uniref:Uncharacterized protein n=1 Tax=Acrobeloides nanus TaxID=290746 RepID=A0A914D0X1_9BILA
MDYIMWSILEAEACSKPHQSIDALKKSLVRAWNAIPQEVIDRAVDDFPKHTLYETYPIVIAANMASLFSIRILGKDERQPQTYLIPVDSKL